MYRNIEEDLFNWKNSKNRMPLMVIGARQVGKTYTINKFGETHFDNLIYINFEAYKDYINIFDVDLNPTRIINRLQEMFYKTITPNTLIFFDEIQYCKNALTSLKYFCEERPEIPVIAAGSLLGIAVKRGQYSFPVGKIDFLYMYPLSFDEFLLVANEKGLKEFIENSFKTNTPLPSSHHENALYYFRSYLSTGGFPAVVQRFLEKRHLDNCEVAISAIIASIELDLSQYCDPNDAVKNKATYNSIFSQLARESKKFKYSLINSSARAASYETALNWLLEAGLIIKVHKANEGKIPLFSYRDLTSYKIYINDVGILSKKIELISKSILEYSKIGGELKGSLIENYVAQSLTSNGFTLYYWESNGIAELDFLIEIDGKVIPIETKAGLNTKAKSLMQFCKKYDIDWSIRISASNFGFENNIKSVPLYAVWCIKKNMTVRKL